MRRALGALLAIVGVAGVVAAHLALSHAMRVPIIHPDELGYLLNARYLALGGARSPVEYYPGFSLLLIPLWSAHASPVGVYHSALAVQAGLSGVGAVLVWELCRLLAPDRTGWRRVLIAAVGCAYPSTLLFSDLALSEVAFATLFAAVVLISAWALASRSPLRFGILGIATGLLVLVHPRGLAVVVATVVLAALVLGVRRSAVACLTALAGGLVVSLAVTEILVRAVRSPSTQLGAYQAGNVVSKSLNGHGLISLAVEAAGQLFYLSVTTAGLVPLALVIGTVALWRVARGDRRPLALAQAYATLSFLGVWALSSLFINLGNRADKLVYGRYNEGVIAPLLVIALAEVLGRDWRRWLVSGAVAIAGTGAAVIAGDTKAALFGPINPINILGLMPLVSRMGGHLHILSIGAVGLGAVVVLGLVAIRWPAVSIVVLIAVFVASAVDTETSYVLPGSRARASQDVIADAITTIGRSTGRPIGCVAYDPAPLGYGDYNYFEDQFLDPAQQYATYDSAGTAPPCGTLVVSRSDRFSTEHPGAREITAENDDDQVLWAVPGGTLFGVLAQGGWLSPAGASSPMTATDLAGGRVRVPGGAVVVAQGTTRTVTVDLVHGPGGAPWPAVAALHSGSGLYGVRLTVQSLHRGVTTSGVSTACLAPPGLPVAASCTRLDLPSTLLPGQRIDLPVTVTVAATVQPGRYTIDVGLVQEGVGAFEAHATITVAVP